MIMKNKNDFKDTGSGSGDLKIEVTRPERCLHCGYDNVESVELSGTNSRPFIKRFSDKIGIGRFFPKQHHVYGWRCTECGYIMLFTARFLD
jgi:uncharacterized OB-fold protein